MSRTLPSALTLTRAQHSGWACVWCGKPLKSGAILAGRAEGFIGAHDLSIDVYAHPECHEQATVEPQQGGTACPSVPAATSRSKASRESGQPTRVRAPEAR